ncbi:MAG TPA: DUF2203 domain-containing protein [Pyrinomonadaceae bacterium]|jgi:hypothetical protein
MKLFKVEEANALLPTARGIVEAVQRAYKRLVSFRDEARRAAEGAEQGGGGFAPGSGAYVAALLSLVERTGELEALGVQLKDHARGLIDFPCMRDGRVVLLCWQLGEGDEIQWWHDVDAGFAGRQPL